MLINDIINYACERHKLRLLRTWVRLPSAPPLNFRENTMKISKRQLKQIIRKTIKESFSGSYTPSGMRMDNRPKIPVNIDNSRHTSGVHGIDTLIAAIDNLAVEKNLEQGEIKGLRRVANKLNDCMMMGDDSEVCAMEILDDGLDGAFSELGYIVTGELDHGDLNNYILDVERIMDEGLMQ